MSELRRQAHSSLCIQCIRYSFTASILNIRLDEGQNEALSAQNVQWRHMRFTKLMT